MIRGRPSSRRLPKAILFPVTDAVVVAPHAHLVVMTVVIPPAVSAMIPAVTASIPSMIAHRVGHDRRGQGERGRGQKADNQSFHGCLHPGQLLGFWLTRKSASVAQPLRVNVAGSTWARTMG